MYLFNYSAILINDLDYSVDKLVFNTYIQFVELNFEGIISYIIYI